MKCCRITAVLVGDGKLYDDDDESKIIMDLRINNERKIVTGGGFFFGYLRDREETEGYQEYTFILRHINGEKINGKIDYLDCDRKSDHRLNIFDKSIRVDELFTFFVYSGAHVERYTYRITDVDFM